jgi:hypothetical protein
MGSSGSRAGEEGHPGRASARAGSADSLVREVRWQLFRRDELPARMRRLQRLEEVAESEARPNGGTPETEHPER